MKILKNIIFILYIVIKLLYWPKICGNNPPTISIELTNIISFMNHYRILHHYLRKWQNQFLNNDIINLIRRTLVWISKQKYSCGLQYNVFSNFKHIVIHQITFVSIKNILLMNEWIYDKDTLHIWFTIIIKFLWYFHIQKWVILMLRCLTSHLKLWVQFSATVNCWSV